MNVLVWHHHGSWLTALVQGPHRYLVPVVPDRGDDGRGRARTWNWPPGAVEVTPADLCRARIDCVIVQRSRDLHLLWTWCRLVAGVDVPTVWLEHDTPPDVTTPHPATRRPGLPIVHVTPFNATAWDNGTAAVHVVEHGVVDPGVRWTGETPRSGVVCNDPLRRGRVVGTDLLARFTAGGLGVDLFGMHVHGTARAVGVPHDRLREFEDPPQDVMHRYLSRRRLYLHLTRWTSFGLSLVEAMTIGMPVVVLATTEAPRSVPARAGAVSTDVTELVDAVTALTADRERAVDAGAAARETAVERFGLQRFLDDWDDVLTEVTA